MSRPMFLSPQPQRPGRLDASGVVVVGIALLASAVALGGWCLMLIVGVLGGSLSYLEGCALYLLVVLLTILLPTWTRRSRS